MSTGVVKPPPRLRRVKVPSAVGSAAMAEAVGDHSERVYVSTSLGSVLRVNLAKRAVECVYRLHQSGLDERIFPITRIAYNDGGGYFATAANDGMVREAQPYPPPSPPYFPSI